MSEVTVISRLAAIPAQQFIFRRWRYPDGSHPKIFDIVKFFCEALPVASLGIFKFSRTVLKIQCSVIGTVAVIKSVRKHHINNVAFIKDGAGIGELLNIRIRHCICGSKILSNIRSWQNGTKNIRSSCKRGCKYKRETKEQRQQ